MATPTTTVHTPAIQLLETVRMLQQVYDQRLPDDWQQRYQQLVTAVASYQAIQIVITRLESAIAELEDQAPAALNETEHYAEALLYQQRLDAHAAQLDPLQD